jgi:hypothetical protein
MQTQDTKVATPNDRPIYGLPVDADALFSDKNGVRKKSVEKKKTKLLQKLTFLSRFLGPDERIIFLTTACSPFSALEQMTIGYAWVYMMKRALLVFTNKRILHVPTTAKYEYRGSLAQILYQDCRKQYVKGSTFLVEYHSGKKERFHGIPGADRAAIKRLNIEAGEFGPRSERPERNHLCPNCAAVLAPQQYACPSCNLAFRNKAKAWRYSLLIPGGGYFYVRRWGMGILDAIVESYLLLILVGAGVASLLGDPEALSVAAMMAVVLTLEKLITIYHANQFLTEFIPQDLKALQTQRPAQPTPAPKPQPQAESSEPQKENIERILSLR